MTHQFSQIPRAEIPRSVFNRTHGYKTTFDAGKLVPFYVDEVLPGDSFNLKATLFARLATPIFPIMDNMVMDCHYFFVPNRLIWDNFQKFMGEKTDPIDYDDPEENIDYLVPQIVAPAVTGWTTGSLADYMGIPTDVPELETSSLWHRAYNLIFNEWYRDQNIQDSLTVDKDDGPDDPADYVLQNRNKRHDYFTSGLPWPQKGPGVELPLGGEAPVIGTGSSPWFINQNDATERVAYMSADGTLKVTPGPAGQGTLSWKNDTTKTGLKTDLSTATSATINSLRQAFQIQKLYERDARGGTRYTELVRSHFMVTSPDARLQRPEYLGGSSSPLAMREVPQTSETTSTPQATLSAIGTITSQSGFTKSFTEHGIVIGLVSVRADLTYQQGLPRMFSRQTRFDFYWPGLAHLGEQAILNKEIFCDGSANDDDVFAYQERWSEYRYYPSKITGLFRSTAAGSLDAWHLSQEFDDLPTLSPAFIEENPPMARVIAVNTEPHFILDSYIQNRTARPMPVYSVPGLIDHF